MNLQPFTTGSDNTVVGCVTQYVTLIGSSNIVVQPHTIGTNNVVLIQPWDSYHLWLYSPEWTVAFWVIVFAVGASFAHWMNTTPVFGYGGYPLPGGWRTCLVTGMVAAWVMAEVVLWLAARGSLSGR